MYSIRSTAQSRTTLSALALNAHDESFIKRIYINPEETDESSNKDLNKFVIKAGESAVSFLKEIEAHGIESKQKIMDALTGYDKDRDAEKLVDAARQIRDGYFGENHPLKEEVYINGALRLRHPDIEWLYWQLEEQITHPFRLHSAISQDVEDLAKSNGGKKLISIDKTNSSLLSIPDIPENYFVRKEDIAVTITSAIDAHRWERNPLRLMHGASAVTHVLKAAGDNDAEKLINYIKSEDIHDIYQFLQGKLNNIVDQFMGEYRIDQTSENFIAITEGFNFKTDINGNVIAKDIENMFKSKFAKIVEYIEFKDRRLLNEVKYSNFYLVLSESYHDEFKMATENEDIKKIRTMIIQGFDLLTKKINQVADLLIDGKENEENPNKDKEATIKSIKEALDADSFQRALIVSAILPSLRVMN